MLADKAQPGALGEVTLQQRAGVHVPQRARFRGAELIHECGQWFQAFAKHVVVIVKTGVTADYSCGRSRREEALFNCLFFSQSLLTSAATGDFITRCQANDAFSAGQNFLWFDSFGRGAFEPGHFTVALFGKPVLELMALAGVAALVNRQSSNPSSDARCRMISFMAGRTGLT